MDLVIVKYSFSTDKLPFNAKLAQFNTFYGNMKIKYIYFL